ncbi:MAG: patatin-like phospholipase family protein [Patescibacteria group bacterium]|jgi:NTE family protein
MTEKKPKIGIALGCGGARGLAHLGVLKVLVREGIKIDMLVGVSIGSLIGAYFALGRDLNELEREALSFNKRKAIRQLVDLSTFRRSILRGKKVHKYIEKLFGDAEFKDAKIPFEILAADLGNGKEVIIKSGGIAKAIQASISVPGIFPPVKYGDSYLVDGGIINPTPTEKAEKMGADIVIGVDLIKRSADKIENPSLITTLLLSYEIIRNQGAMYCYGRTENGAIIIRPKISDTVNAFRFDDIEKFIRAGETAAEAAMPEIKKRIKEYKEK